jgi:hypothetical protein
VRNFFGRPMVLNNTTGFGVAQRFSAAIGDTTSDGFSRSSAAPTDLRG